jgi:hypothetical protein
MLLSIMLMLGVLCWQIGDIEDSLNELSSVAEYNETIDIMPLGEWIEHQNSIDASLYQVKDIIFTSDSNPDAFKATGFTVEDSDLKNILRGKSMDSS